MKNIENHIAVTGTKGKSTVLRILQHSILLNGASVWGTYGLDGRYHNGEVFKKTGSAENYLEVLKDADVHLSEATSYVLSLEGIYQEESLSAAIFTSFDPMEHMELHYDKNKYLACKTNIFKYLKKSGVAIINRDMEDFSEIFQKADCKVITYGFHEDSDCLIKKIEQNMFSSKFELNYKGKKHTIVANLTSNCNMSNIAASMIALIETTNIPLDLIIKSISDFPGLKGRFNLFKIRDSDTEVIIDYAHTPGSLENLLSTVKEVSKRKLICIFGCGGNKSIKKRSFMGKIAEKFADKIIITNDNPRQESPHKIANDILKNVKDKAKFEVILDRDLAIKSTLHSNQNCIIVIAGKGAEGSIEFNNFDYPFNDHNSVLTYAISNQYVLLKAQKYVN